MVDELINYYEKDLSHEKLVIEKMDKVLKRFNPANFNIVLSALVGLILFICCFCISYNQRRNIIIIIVSIVTIGSSFYKLNKNYKKALKKNYSIETNRFLCAGNEYNLIIKKRMVKFLRENNIDECKIRNYIEIIDRRLESKKYEPYINIGILGALIIPVWSEFLEGKFDMCKSIKEQISLLIVVSIFVFAVYSLGKWIRDLSLLLSYSFNEKRRLKNLKNLLEEIALESNVKLESGELKKWLIKVSMNLKSYLLGNW